MKINEIYDLQSLKKFGFEDCSDTGNWDFSDSTLCDFERKYNSVSENFGENVANLDPDFVLDFGASWRGQPYYCLIKNREISIFYAGGVGSDNVNLPIKFIEFIAEIKPYLK